jgi:hypothetical protein
VFSARGDYSPEVVFARRAKFKFVNVRRFGPKLKDQPYHIDNVIAYLGQFRTWLLRFRGVATRYLKNYLVWSRTLSFWKTVDAAAVLAQCALAGVVAA